MVQNSRLYPGVLALLGRLKQQGIRIGIVTTKFHYRIDAILEKCQGAAYIDSIVGGEDVSSPKPDPEGVLSLLGLWGLKGEEVLYVGDSVVDAKTAQAAGVAFAGVTTGTTAEEELRKYPCVGVYHDLGELVEGNL